MPCVTDVHVSVPHLGSLGSPPLQYKVTHTHKHTRITKPKHHIQSHWNNSRWAIRL